MAFVSAEVKSISTTTGDALEKSVPADLESFCIAIRAEVGPWGGEGTETFDINVCTSKWIEGKVKNQGFVVGRHYLVVESYDAVQIKSIITKLIQRYQANTWQEVAEKVSRIGHWEFEDYRESP
jgi:hypothetical protein